MQFLPVRLETSNTSKATCVTQSILSGMFSLLTQLKEIYTLHPVLRTLAAIDTWLQNSISTVCKQADYKQTENAVLHFETL